MERMASAVVPNAVGYKDERPGLGSLVIRLESWLLSRVAPGTLSNVERHFGRHIWLREVAVVPSGKRAPTLALALSFCLLWLPQHSGYPTTEPCTLNGHSAPSE